MDARVTISGFFGKGNLGDDMLVLAAVDALSNAYAASDIVVLCHEDASPLRRWRPSCRFLRRAELGVAFRTDLLVYGGGTQFFSFAETHSDQIRRSWASLQVKRLRQVARPRALVRRLLAAPRVVNPLTQVRFQQAAAFCVGIGPFVPWSEEETSARLRLAACEYLSVRDSVSLETCKEWGLEHAVLRADPCYGSEVHRSLGAGEEPAQAGRPRSVTVVVQEWPHSRRGQAYLRPLIQAVQQLRHRGVHVRYAAFCERADRRVVRGLEGKGEQVLVWRPADCSPDAYVRALTDASLIITTRAHGAILGAVCGVPSICVAIGPKQEVIAKQLGEGARIWGWPFRAGSLVELTQEMLDGGDRLRGSVLKTVDALRLQADSAARELASFARRSAKVTARCPHSSAQCPPTREGPAVTLEPGR